MNQFKAISVIKLLAVTFSLFITNVFASNITSGSGFAAEQHGENGILTIAEKNEISNISFNEYTNFNVLQPLIIYNGSNVKSTDTLSTADSAKVIVISADSVQLNSHIQIIGAPADLLIISDGEAPVSCNNCSFSNVNRLTIANSKTLTSDQNYIGTISTFDMSSSLTVNNLSAPGSVSVELIATDVNISGTIDTNLRADNHPSNGMIINELGNNVIGSGGVNIYAGELKVDYADLHLTSIVANGSLQLSGTINSASIAITSAKTVTIPSDSTLNTLSDALSSSTRNGQFYAPLEGIFISTMKNNNADVNINGALATDNSIALKSNGDINIAQSSSIVSKVLDLLANGDTSTHGLIQTTTFDNDSLSYKNTGNATASNMTVIAKNNLINGEGGKLQSNNMLLTSIDKSIFNSYGAEIKANVITFASTKGAVINGSKTNVINYDATTENLTLDATALEWGIKPTTAPTGTTTTNLSAHIFANIINISTKRLENINPYSLTKPSGVSWNNGINLSSATSNQVSIQAENEFKILADTYVLNSSAIIALNQNGVFHVNSPKLVNERYHLKADTFKYTQMSLSDADHLNHDVIESGSTTQIIGYSPPGRLITFGELKFNHVSSSSQAEFINSFSYFEAFENLYFYKSDVHTLGIETSTLLTTLEIQSLRKCLIRQICNQTYTLTSAEAETLFSVHGNVYGVNPNLPSVSDITISNISTLTTQIQTLVTEFLETLISGTHEDRSYSYIKTSNINETDNVLSATITTCTTRTLARDGNEDFTTCSDRNITKSISELLDTVTADNEFANTGYTYNQLVEATTAYVKALPLIDVDNNIVDSFPIMQATVAQYKENRSVLTFSSEENSITIIFKQHYIYQYQGGSNDASWTLTKTVPLTTLIPYISTP